MTFRELLSTRPYIGVVSPIAGALLPTVHSLIPFIQLAGLVVGLAVGILTLWIKWQEMIIKRTERRKKEADLIEAFRQKEINARKKQ
jgi:hypothetical protein